LLEGYRDARPIIDGKLNMQDYLLGD